MSLVGTHRSKSAAILNVRQMWLGFLHTYFYLQHASLTLLHQ
jgi:hypothetical protein